MRLLRQEGWHRKQCILRLVGALCVVAVSLDGAWSQDRAPSTAEDILSLDQAVHIALQNNPRLKAAMARVGQAEARLGAAKAARGFHLNLQSTAIRSGPEVSFSLAPFGAGEVVVSPTFRYIHSLQLQKNVYDGGRRSAQQSIAAIGREVAQRGLQQTRDDITLEVKVAYFEVLRARRLREVGQETLKAAEEHLRVTKARFQAGVTAKFDVLRSEAEVEDARQRLIDDEALVAFAEAQFNTVLGRPLMTPVNIASVEDMPVMTVTLEKALETAHTHRPELLALQQQVDIAQQQIRLARAGWKPNLDVVSNYDRTRATAFQRSTAYALTAVLTVPLFDSGLARAQVAEAQKSLKEAEQHVESVRQRVELEVKQAYLNLSRARQRRVTAEKQLAAAAESLRVSEVRYNAGVGTNVEVTDARVAWTRARWNQVNALYDYLVALAQLEHAMGTTVAALASTG
ncbi:MAG: TolC family protein [Abditibacteriales bacterium]|nr:TolC family protein [Abditibacteriales bacterium]MDW8366811.1 TolC family protein [Abditibacteriales bacterium]